MSQNKITVKDVVDYFNFEQLVGDEHALDREISIADTNRPGLELAGYFDYSQKKRIIVFGDKEIEYIKVMDEDAQRKSFDFLTSLETPMLIISKHHECPEILIKIARLKNFPILRSIQPTSRLITNIVSYLDERLAPMDCFHGVLLSMNGKGVMIRGESGIGKSEVALELVRRGHQLVADDRVDCYQVHNSIVGRAPKLLEGMLEIRGVGIIDVARMYGANTTLPRSNVDVVVELTPWDSNANYDRVGIENTKYENILDVEVPKIILPVREGRSMGIVIESAVANIVLKEQGFDSAKEFEKRVLEFIDVQNKGE
ncbi:MAG: HPr(Ser) kinase/phosphatase [Erysipelotrichia bacterium]|nr:HPr(Ser) kinase/phosphatase [Erysipelotrichia bacterium]NCC55684.1 HPr(Ser) kinase/phosphatase [Erysipelotrichia bacterium]